MKYREHWIKHAELISSLSKCPRGKVGAVIVDQFNNPISMGFNGSPRGSSGHLCKINICERTELNIKSGTSIEIGCHHAEANALMNALKNGVSVNDCDLFITCSPCLICSKLIHHSGIKRVYYPASSSYDRRGRDYLVNHKITVIELD